MKLHVAIAGTLGLATALRLKQAVPGADLLRAMLCSDGEVYLYVISVLRKDGRVVHVIVDGPSGTVASTQ